MKSYLNISIFIPATRFKDTEYLYRYTKFRVHDVSSNRYPSIEGGFSLEINLYAWIKSMVPVGGFSFASLNNVFNRGLILAIELHSLVNRAPLFLLNPSDLIPSVSFRFTLKSYQHGFVSIIFFLIFSLFISVYIYIYNQRATLYISWIMIHELFDIKHTLFNFPLYHLLIFITVFIDISMY